MHKEQLPNGYTVWVDEQSTFGTDAVLLAAFAQIAGGERVCDLGTGCGVMPILWQSADRAVTVDAVEVYAPAAALAQKSVEENGLCDRITIYNDDWKTVPLESGRYDRVVCNPPYFSAGSGKVSDHPARRLARHEDADTLPSVIATAARLLKVGGHFCLCHRPERAVDVLVLLRQNGLEPKRIEWVRARADLPPFLMLCDAVKGGKPSVSVSIREGTE